MAKQNGVVKLIGIAGFVEGEEFIIRVGQTVTIGRSRECDISLRNCKKYLKVDPDQTNSAEHFRSVSRTHSTIEVKAPDEIYIRDNSSNGTFLDGRRLKKKGALVRNLPDAPHELKLGTNEAVKIVWQTLVPRKKVKFVKVYEGEEPPDGAKLFEGDEADLNAATIADGVAAFDASGGVKSKSKRGGRMSRRARGSENATDNGASAAESDAEPVSSAVASDDGESGEELAATGGRKTSRLNRRLSRKKSKDD